VFVDIQDLTGVTRYLDISCSFRSCLPSTTLWTLAQKSICSKPHMYWNSWHFSAPPLAGVVAGPRVG